MWDCFYSFPWNGGGSFACGAADCFLGTILSDKQLDTLLAEWVKAWKHARVSVQFWTLLANGTGWFLVDVWCHLDCCGQKTVVRAIEQIEHQWSEISTKPNYWQAYTCFWKSKHTSTEHTFCQSTTAMQLKAYWLILHSITTLASVVGLKRVKWRKHLPLALPK